MYSNTQNALRSAWHDQAGLDPALGERHHLAGRDLAQVLGADQVERARLAGHAIGRAAAVGSSIIPSASGRSPWGSRKATTASSVIDHGRERSACSRGRTSATASSIRSAGCVASSAAMISESEVERNGTSRPRSSECSSTALIRLPLWASASVRLVVADDRLGVLPLRGAGGRVAHVADRQVADQRAQRVLVEHLGDEPLIADRHHAAAARGRWRFRPTPGRGAGARTARSRRAGRRRGSGA